jgi:hypothetical protein
MGASSICQQSIILALVWDSVFIFSGWDIVSAVFVGRKNVGVLV